MKRIVVMIILTVCILVVAVGYIYSSRTYFVNINEVYKLQYGNRFIPVIEQLCTIRGIDYLYCPEMINANKVSVLVYVPPLPLTREVNYLDAFLVTGYIDIYEYKP